MNDINKIGLGFAAIYRRPWKLIILALYVPLAIFTWCNRSIVFDFIQITEGFPLYSVVILAIDIITALLLIMIFIKLIIIIGALNGTGGTSTVKTRKITLKDKRLVEDMINLLVVGRTNSGKSYALMAILYLLAEYRNAIITICDFKKSSFAIFADTPNFYGYEDVPRGIREFYKEFTRRLEANDEERNKQICVLLIDEYSALISSRDKKEADELMTMVGNMLFMGRSLGIVVLIGIQRADSVFFKAGARDQFAAVLALGNLSKEQKNMLLCLSLFLSYSITAE